MPSITGKSVVITGASSGIGAFLARELTARGARVGLLARREERLRELAAEIRDGGGEVAWRVADVTDEGLTSALDGLEEELGAVDVVVANAGYGTPESVRDFKAGRSVKMYEVNLLGALRLFDWAIPRFAEKGSGHIVGVASVASYLGMTGSPSYCGSKAAMRVHLQSLRVTLRRHGIAVTTICPGFVESELTAKNRFSMPFLWKTDRAARRIAGAIEKRHGEVIFPWQMWLLIVIGTRILPTAMLEAAMARLSSPKKAGV